MEITVIASGSNGNCCLVEEKNTAVLIDAGKSAREIEARLDCMGKNLENISGLLLTHAHTDHCMSAGTIARKYNIPIYMTKEVQDESVKKIGKTIVKNFSLDSDFKVEELKVKPIITSHDVPSCGFVMGKFGIFTDTGKITPEMEDSIKKLKGVLIESNHDIDMLVKGRYPAFLKHRILSDNGHLSNIHASEFIQKKAKELDWVLLGHLSGNNNTKEKVEETFDAIVKKNIDYSVLSRNKESGNWNI